MDIEMGIEMGIRMKWTIEFNQTIMDKNGFSIRKSTLFNVLLIQRLKKNQNRIGYIGKKVCPFGTPYNVVSNTFFCEIMAKIFIGIVTIF